MEKLVARPKNADLGKQSKDKRIPVQVTANEKAELEAAAKRHGHDSVSTWMRSLALRVARSEDG